jgi:hypothetical protein
MATRYKTIFVFHPSINGRIPLHCLPNWSVWIYDKSNRTPPRTAPPKEPLNT